MYRHRSLLRSSSTAVALLLACVAPSRAAPSAVGEPPSTALGIDAHLSVDGIGTQYGPIAIVQGNSAGPYDDKVDVTRENDTIALYPANPTPSIFVYAKGMSSEVKSDGIQLDSVSTEADAGLGSISLSLNLNPPPPLASPVPIPFLTVMGTGVRSRVDFTRVFPNADTALGQARFDSLSISGNAIGGATLNFSGTVKPNTVAYQSPTVTITLNKQEKVGIISCGPNCTFTVTSLTTVAVDISLNKANWFGRTVTGDIAIGETQAQAQ